jgi:hypothetical protein
MRKSQLGFIGGGTSVHTHTSAASGGDLRASQAELETATQDSEFATPLRAKYSPSAVKARCFVTVAAGVPTLGESHNVTSITDNGVGDFTVNFTNAFFSSQYTCFGMCRGGPGNVALLHENIDVIVRSATAIRLYTLNQPGAAFDAPMWSASFAGILA